MPIYNITTYEYCSDLILININKVMRLLKMIITLCIVKYE